MNNTVDPICSFSQNRTYPCAVSSLDLLILQGVWRNIDITLALGLFVSKEMFELSSLTKIKGKKLKTVPAVRMAIPCTERKEKKDVGHTMEFRNLRFGITGLDLNLVIATYQWYDLIE